MQISPGFCARLCLFTLQPKEGRGGPVGIRDGMMSDACAGQALTTMSASMPGARAPFRSCIPASLAACVLHSRVRSSGVMLRFRMPLQVPGRPYCKPACLPSVTAAVLDAT